jgi:hypothetical protein
VNAPELDIHDYVNQLTRTHTHSERYEVRDGLETWSRTHHTRAPSLIEQLIDGSPASSGEINPGSSTFGSRPAARLEALDTVMLIDDEASRWLKRLGEDDPGDKLDVVTGQHIAGSGTIRCIKLLHGLHAAAKPCERPKGRDCCTAHHIEHDIRRWWHQARIITGWDSPAWRPDNTCPVCEIRRSLRVNLTSQTAMCVECREVWDTVAIGLLAEHIRSENAEDDDLEQVPVA